MDLFAASALCQGLLGELVGRELKGKRTIMGHASEDDAHYVRDCEAKRLKDSGRLLLDLMIDASSHYCIFGHRMIVAQTGYSGYLRRRTWVGSLEPVVSRVAKAAAAQARDAAAMVMRSRRWVETAGSK